MQTASLVRAFTGRPLILTFAIAVIARLAFILRSGVAVGADTSGYRLAADALRSSLLTADERFLTLPPLLPAYLAIIRDDRVAALGIALLGALVAPLMVLTVRRHYGSGAALLAGIGAALEPAFVFWSGYLLTDTFGLIAIAASLERTSAALAGGSRGASLLAGMAAGVGLLARAAVAPLALLFAAGIGLRLRTFVPVLLFALGAVLVLALPVGRNAIAAGEPMLYRDQGWYLLWAGSRWDTVGRGTTGMDIVLPPEHERWTREERASYYRADLLATVRDRPLDYAGRAALKAVWFWLPFYPEWSIVHKAWAGAYYLALYATALAGALISRRTAMTRLLVASAVVLTLIAMVTIVDYDARYRIPAELVLLPLAAVAITRLTALVRR